LISPALIADSPTTNRVENGLAEELSAEIADVQVAIENGGGSN